MKRKLRKLLIYGMIFLMFFGLIPATAFAVGTGDINDTTVMEDYSNYLIRPLDKSYISEDGLSVQGGPTEYDVANSRNYCKKEVSKGTAKKITATTGDYVGGLKITASIKFPSLGKGMIYNNKDDVRVVIAKGVDNSKTHGAGYSTCSVTKDQAGHLVPTSYPNYGTLGCLHTKFTSSSGEGLNHRKYTNTYNFRHPHGGTYTWKSYTTQTSTGYKNQNYYNLGTKEISIASGESVPSTISYSKKLTEANYKKLMAWCKSMGLPKTTKDGVEYYQAVIAVAYRAPVSSSSYQYAGCAQHGQYISGTHACNCGFPHFVVDNKSACTTSGTLGSKCYGDDVNGGNPTEYVNSSVDCSIVTYGDILIPTRTTSIDVEYIDMGKPYGHDDYDVVLNDDYDSKTYTLNALAKPSDWVAAAPAYPGYKYTKEQTLTVPAAGGEVYRYYDPAPAKATCVNRFYKGTTLQSTSPQRVVTNVVHGQPVNGADTTLFGALSSEATANYTYVGATSATCNATIANGVTVYRNYDLGSYSVIYHGNAEGVTGTIANGSAYVGDTVKLAAGGYSRVATNGSNLSWKLAGWSKTEGATSNDQIDYTLGSTINPGLGKGGVLHLYAVWEPALKIRWDEGIEKLSVPGLREGETETGVSGTITYHNYLSLIRTLEAIMKDGRHVKDVELNGKSVTEYLDMEINGTLIREWVDKLKNGEAINAPLGNCFDINVLSNAAAGNPVKKVVKSGTDTDVNDCIVCVGDTLDYIITLKNSTVIARDYRIVDTLDEGLTFVSATGNYTYADGVVTWLVEDAAPEVEQSVKVTVKVNEKKVGDRIENYAETWEQAFAELGETEELYERSERVVNYVIDTPQKHLRSDETSEEVLDDTVVVGGDEAYYTIAIENPSITDAKSFNVRDVIPKDFMPISASDNGSISGQTVTWSGISVPAKGIKTISVKVRAKDAMSGEDILNHAEVTCTDAFGAKIDSTEVLNYSMKAPEKTVYETLDEELKPVAETEIVNIDDQVIGDGKLITYRINWMNPTAGNRDIILKDTVPENTRIATSADLDKAMQGISLAEDKECLNGGTYLITDGGIYDDATKEITWSFESESSTDATGEGFVEFTVVVLDSAQDTYVKNVATQTLVSPTGINEHNPTAPSNEVKNPVLPTPDKIATRADGQDVTELVVNDGEEITYEITFKNPAVDARDFTVTDIIPEFTKLVSSSISDGGVYDAAANMITWELTLNGGETKTVSFSVEVLTEAQNQTVKNTARVYVDRADKKTKEDEPTKIFILEDPTKAVLNLDGEDINGIVKRAGDIITYNIVYKNPADTERVATVTDVLPKGVSFVSATHQGSYDVETGEFVNTTNNNFKASYDEATNTVVWSVPTAAKCQEMVSVDVRILDEARDTVLCNVASVYIPDATKQTNEVRTPVAPNPIKTATDDLGQDLDGNLVTVGEEITYTITFKNPAEEAKTGFITDTLPIGVDFVSADMKGMYDSTMHTVFWKDIPMKAGEELKVNVVVRVNEKAASETIGNEAVYRIDEASVSTRIEDGGQGGPKSYVSTKYVLNDKGEDIDKSVVMKGSLLVYKITYKNITTTEKHFTILDVLPEGVEIVNVGDSGFFAVNPLPGLEEHKLPKNRAVAWQFYLQPMEEDYVTVTVRVTDEKVGEILYNNAIFAVQDTTDTAQLPFIKQTNTVENPVLENPVKMVFNTAEEEITDKMVSVGDEITYKITFVNPSDETKITDIRDMLPNEVTFISCDYSGEYNKSLHMVKWSDLEVEGHERITVSCRVKVKENAGGKTIQNQGTVIMDEAAITTRAKTKDSDPDDPKPSDNPTTDNYVACKKSYNAAGKDITGQVVKVGDTVTYRIMFKNTSEDVKKYIVKDTLPEEVDFVSATGDYTFEDGTLVWNTELAGGNSGTYDVVVTFNEKALGKVVKNQANIFEYDPELPDDPYETTPPPADNPVFDEDDFIKKAVDKKGKDISNAFVGVGSDLNYVITLHNPSEKAVEFTVTDALPKEVTFAGCSEGGQYNEEEHSVSWVLALEGDAKAVLEIATKVKTSVESASIVNKAHLITSSTEMDSNEVYNYVLSSPVKKMFAGLTELKNGESVEGNTSVTFSISYSNPTDTTRTITIVDKLDADIADRVFSITDDGILRDGVITWTLEVKPGVSGEVSFIVSSPNVSGAEVVNKATVSLDNEGVTGVTTLDTNKVYYNCVPEDKPTDHPEDGGDDPGREIVKTGDFLVE